MGEHEYVWYDKYISCHTILLCNMPMQICYDHFTYLPCSCSSFSRHRLKRTYRPVLQCSTLRIVQYWVPPPNNYQAEPYFDEKLYSQSTAGYWIIPKRVVYSSYHIARIVGIGEVVWFGFQIYPVVSGVVSMIRTEDSERRRSNSTMGSEIAHREDSSSHGPQSISTRQLVLS